ncbi:MAG: alpha-amylase family glycosyl hydrolase [Chloroflexota bacterium]|nr:alpha-amylase family glycosyl hydrolase [Chloroflexota bacterium]
MVDYVHSPDWIRDLMVYEIAPRSFTSPQGPGSGTFNSLREKLPYLHELGITGIWLTGHSLADSKHFYNIWTQYACIEPDVIDPTLGSEQDFKEMIALAHEYGIRVFLDVIEHGVMADSPLVQRKPHWFRGKSWGMVDYDFDLHDPELDQWWVDMWTRYVVEFGVDGYRIDLGMRRVDLWLQVRENAARAGREIIFINELNYQGGLEFSQQSELTRIPPRDEFLKAIDFVQRDPPTLLSPHRKRPDEINGQHGYANTWGKHEWDAWLHSIMNRSTVSEVPPFAYSSGQISSHDNGWEGFEFDNPYVAQGSRFIFGYGSLFSGLVPIWVSGEEFDAPFVPLPDLSPYLFGGAEPGKGKWLYGGVVQWDALEQPTNRAMFDDVKRLIAIRKRESDILGAVPSYGDPHLIPLAYQSDVPLPQPYARWTPGKAVAVVGNPDASRDVTVHVTLPLEQMGLAGHTHYRLTHLWTDEQRVVEVGDLDQLQVDVKRDKSAGGGLTLLKIEPA